MNTPFLPAEPTSPIEAEAAALDPEAQRTNFNPKHPMPYMVHEGEPRVDGLSIDPAPLPVLGTDASRGLG